MCLTFTERERVASVGGLHLLYSVEETAGNMQVVTVPHSDPPSSSVLDYSNPCLIELAGNKNCAEFTEVSSKT